MKRLLSDEILLHTVIIEDIGSGEIHKIMPEESGACDIYIHDPDEWDFADNISKETALDLMRKADCLYVKMR